MNANDSGPIPVLKQNESEMSLGEGRKPWRTNIRSAKIRVNTSIGQLKTIINDRLIVCHFPSKNPIPPYSHHGHTKPRTIAIRTYFYTEIRRTMKTSQMTALVPQPPVLKFRQVVPSTDTSLFQEVFDGRVYGIEPCLCPKRVDCVGEAGVLDEVLIVGVAIGAPGLTNRDI